MPASDCCPSGLISSPRARGAAVSNTGVAHIDVKENLREDEMLRVPTFSSWFEAVRSGLWTRSVSHAVSRLEFVLAQKSSAAGFCK